MKRVHACLAARRLVIAAIVSGLLAGWCRLAWADPAPPDNWDRNIAQTFALLLRREHLSKRPFDREIYNRAVTQFVKALDPGKMYFYQSDVDGFYARQNELEKVPKNGDVSFAHEIFRICLARVDERMQMVEKLLAMPHDFSVEEDYVVDRDAAKFAKDEAEAFDRWRRRVKYDLLVQKADRLEKEKKAAQKEAKAAPADPSPPEPALKPLSPEEATKEAIEKVRRRYEGVRKRMHQVDKEELLEMYLSALSSGFDPQTSYMSPSTVENFDIQMGLKLEGIGAALQWVDGYTTVQKIIPGGPAEKDGRLKVEDRIVGVGQDSDGPFEDVVEMKLTDVVKKIRGTAGTIVRLQVMPARTEQTKIIQLTREKIQLKDSEARAKIFEEGRKADGQPYRIGVIDLPSFYMDMTAARAGRRDFKSTTRDVARILDEFNRQQVDALVLDLRRNLGGSLQEAIDLTALFVGDGPVVQVKGVEGIARPYHDKNGSMVWKGPMVVLVSKFSASASEILAGAVQDYHRGLVVGDHTTHGKGTVQSLMDLGEELLRTRFSSKMGALKVTIQQFYRPSGDSVQQRGVVSDIEWPSLTSHLDGAEADLDYAIPFDRVDRVPFRPFGQVTKAIVDQLAQLSQARCAKSAEFDKVRRDIALYERQKKRKAVSLNERKFMEERAEMNADKEEEKKLEEVTEPSSTEIKRDHYLNEALAITTDYLGLLHAAPAAQAAQAASPAREP